MATSLGVIGTPVIAQSSKVEFNRDVRPILSENCFACHGQDGGGRKGKLRLDEREAALIGGKSESPGIVPGQPDESELVLRITEPSDSDDRMPPLDSKKPPLKPEEIAVLRQWIADGAEYQPHWAFVPPDRAKLSLEKVTRGHPIDSFVEAKHRATGLRASSPAAPEVLARRLYLDLTGLPPTLAEMDEFLAAASRSRKTAYEALVGKLLASPRYGEKWARLWLDAARYADSDGYEKDLPRSQWAWRDWVIGAINSDKPYNQFIVEQVAGDLLATPQMSVRDQQDLIVATGYIRNSMVSEEGAIIAEQYRKEAMFDRMDALGKGVLGITVQCAQCHTHKFDPIKHDEYFQMFAFLDDTYEATSRVYGPDKLAVMERITRGIEAAEAKIKSARPNWSSELDIWAAAMGKAAASTPWTDVTPKEVEWEGGLSHPDILPDNSIISLGFRPTAGELRFTAEPSLDGVTGLRLEALTHGDLIFGGPGRNIDGLFAVSELIVEVKPTGESKWTKIPLVHASADFVGESRSMAPFFSSGSDDKRVVGPADFLIDGKDSTAWSPDRGPGRRNASTEFVAQFQQPLKYPAGTQFRGTLVFKHGGEDVHGRSTNHLGRFRVALTTAACPTASPIPTDARLALTLPAAQRRAEHHSALFNAWRTSEPALQIENTQIDQLFAETPPEDTTVLHIAQRTPEHHRTTHLLDRGAWDQPKHAVKPGTPAFLHRMVDGNEPARLAFARWLVDPRSPTAARVAVNRVWQALFGAGLIDSPEDFGIRATEPIFRELLDGLAIEFMDRGWSQKDLIRRIVTSATYQQDSRVTPELLERDPRNRLLARGPRFRADAEVVRDLALHIGGLLEEKVGGPSIYPRVPESFFAGSYSPVEFWVPATGAERYRRSLYIFRRRGMPDPVLANFDAPTGDTACVRRERSNTPLAALASLNESTFVEAAQAFALRVVRHGGPTNTDRVRYAFRLCTGRLPQPNEIAEITKLLDSRRGRLSDGWLSARTMAFGVSEKLPELPPDVTPNDVAAWTVVTRVLLNLDETLSKN